MLTTTKRSVLSTAANNASRTPLCGDAGAPDFGLPQELKPEAGGSFCGET